MIPWWLWVLAVAVIVSTILEGPPEDSQGEEP